MKVLEFGSGGGYMCAEIQKRCNPKEIIGVEINPIARDNAKELGIKSVADASEIEDGWADIIISTHALEHCESPMDILKLLRKKLRVGGAIVFHTPNESCNTEYHKNDVSQHLYTWNPLNLGNLFKAAGYFVYSVERVQEVWPTNYETLRGQISDELFETIAIIGGQAIDKNNCVIVAFND